ncbi:MAG: metallophosphoesterase [Kiritimatiellae bacterium]|nr:metallophosphoesterase [Kiritimatiellia bacterium]
MNGALARRGTRCLFLTLAACLWIPTSCENGQQGPESFRFLVLSDLHVRLPGGPDNVDYDSTGNLNNLAHMVNRINTEFADAAFVVVTGDLVGTLYSDVPHEYLGGIPNPAETLAVFLGTLRIPIHLVLGNHDYLRGYDAVRSEGIPSRSCERIEAVWRKVLGIEPYHSFVYHGVRFVLLNSVRGPARDSVCEFSHRETGCTGSFDARQLEWLEAELSQSEPCVLFLHHPVVSDNNEAVRWSLAGASFQLEPQDGFYRLVRIHRQKILAVFVGHGHMWAKDTLYDTIPVYETGPLGDRGAHRDNVHIVTVFPGENAVMVEIGNPNVSGHFSG